MNELGFGQPEALMEWNILQVVTRKPLGSFIKTTQVFHKGVVCFV